MQRLMLTAAVASGEVHSRWRSDLKPRRTNGRMDGRTFGPRLFSAVTSVTIRTCPTLCVTDEDLEDCVATHVSGGETGPPRQTKQALCMLGGGSLKPRSAFKETRGGRRRDWLDGAKKCLSVCVGSIEMVQGPQQSHRASRK